MTVVVPIWQNRVSPVLDYAGHFLVVETNSNQEIGRREVVIGESRPEALVNGIVEVGAQVLLCGAISLPMEMWLRKAGLRIVSHVCGDVDAVLRAFIGGTLANSEFAMPGCWGHRRGKHCCWRNEGAQKARKAAS